MHEIYDIERRNRRMALYMGATVVDTYTDQWTHTSHLLLDFATAWPTGNVKEEEFDFTTGTRKKGAGYPDDWSRYHPSTCLHYHDDWNWLMRVLEKMNESFQVAGARRDLSYTIEYLLSSGYKFDETQLPRLSFTLEHLWERAFMYLENAW